MLPPILRERRDRLGRAFNSLSGTAEIVKSDEIFLHDGEPVIQFSHSVRVARAGVRLVMWEEFRRIESDPQLFGFSYRVAKEDDIAGDKPLFRFECHPNVSEPNTPEGEFKSHYEREPHFHPDETADDPIAKLHFPFHRTERKAVVFAIVNWISVDLVRRFYPS
jgi:hypothetical protein